EEDPLAPFGAVDGELRETPHAATLALRDALIRYTSAHLNFDWNNLSELVEEVCQYDPEKVRLIVTADPETGDRYYGLNLMQLARVANAVVGMQQILDALTEFLRQDPATSFSLDPGYGFLYMLERSVAPMELRFALAFLQMRLPKADNHIRSYFIRIRKSLVDQAFSDQVSSVDSTISDVRREF
ncbi:hypothetical protein B0H12DRAFT_958336, partial [Mycena haematopus]